MIEPGVARVFQGVSGPVAPVCLPILRESVAAPKQYGNLMGLVTGMFGGVAGIDLLVGGYPATRAGFPRRSG